MMTHTSLSLPLSHRVPPHFPKMVFYYYYYYYYHYYYYYYYYYY